MKIVILGLSITSSWGNGHATTYRALVAALVARGHDVLFLERNVPWYAANRDLPRPLHGQTALYADLTELDERFAAPVRHADLVIVGSYVPEGRAACAWALATAQGVTAFYDIDTPVTLAALRSDACDYLARDLVPRFDLYLSFTGGPTLRRLETEFGARRARPLYCAVDPAQYFPEPVRHRWDLGYMGTYGADRQERVEQLLLEPARRLPDLRVVLAGPQYPDDVAWPPNVERIVHLPPAEHRHFYNAQRFTLSITRADMVRAGYSPRGGLFEAGACGTPILSDWWEGLDSFFTPGEEIVVVEDTAAVIEALRHLPEQERLRIGARARERVLAAHAPRHRAEALETYVHEARGA
jgi:spore maturation protein CgeB